MRVTIPRVGRLAIECEDKDEHRLVENMCIGPIWHKDKQQWSMEDTLYNRYVLGIEYRLPTPPENYESVGGLKVVNFYDKLREYQKEDVLKMQTLAYPLNANKPGLGKTIEALFYAVIIGSKKVLIVVPKSVLFQWKSQVERWYLPYFPTNSIQVVQKTSEIVGTADIVILNYEKLHNDNIIRQLQDFNFDLIIADEGHRMRTPYNKSIVRGKIKIKGKTNGAMRKLKGRQRLVLTGTPIMNKPDNLFGTMLWLNPWYFGTAYWPFVEAFCYVKEDFYGKHIEGLTQHEGRAKALSEVLKLIMCRQEVDPGMGVHKIEVKLDMYGKQAKLYEQVKKLAIEELQKEGVSVTNGLDQLIKLQQLTSDPQLFDCTVDVKNEWLMDTLQDNEGTKFVIFSRFKTPLVRLGKKLGKKAVSITGGLSPAAREAAKQEFIHDDSVQVLLGTIGALGEAVDGLQHVCKYIIFIDQMWNPEENNQAIARLVRDGQKSRVTVYTLMCNNTVDEKVARVNVSKMEDILAILS